MEKIDRKEEQVPAKTGYLTLLWTFFRIALFTFGGGYAMIPLIQREIVEKKKWLTDDELLEIVAVAESTPGPIAINTATFVGTRKRGFFGAFFATLGVVLPSFIIIFAIANLLSQFAHIRVVQYAFWGIRAGVLALLVKALINMAKKCRRHIVSYLIVLVAFVAVAVLNLSVILVLVACALVGLLEAILEKRREKK